MQSYEEHLIGLTAEAKYFQKTAHLLVSQAKTLQSESEKVVRDLADRMHNQYYEAFSTINDEFRKGARAGAKEALHGVAQEAVAELIGGMKGVLEAQEKTIDKQNAAADRAEASGLFLVGKGVIFIIALVLAVFAVVGGIWNIGGWLIKNQKNEWAELREKIQQDQVTQAALDTWGVRLQTFNDGTKGIILPHGTKLVRKGEVDDGREAIIIQLPFHF
jgi:hypothetical protein